MSMSRRIKVYLFFIFLSEMFTDICGALHCCWIVFIHIPINAIPHDRISSCLVCIIPQWSSVDFSTTSVTEKRNWYVTRKMFILNPR